MISKEPNKPTKRKDEEERGAGERVLFHCSAYYTTFIHVHRLIFYANKSYVGFINHKNTRLSLDLILININHYNSNS